MLKQSTQSDYRERINKVLQYVNNHLEESLDLNLLADRCAFSKFHFHRIMKAHLNESLGSYIIRLRLDRAARLLRYSGEPVNKIALHCGYDNPSAFHKAFKKKFGYTPLDFRNNKGNFSAEGSYVLPSNYNIMKLKNPQIKNVKEKKVIYVTVNGYSDENIAPAWEKLMTFMKDKKLFSFSLELLGISHDDPNITDRSKCRYDACAAVKKDVSPENEIGFKTISGGKYAIFKYKGPYTGFDNAYGYIYGSWLTESGMQLRNEPGFEKYLNNPGKTKPENLLTEIYIPVE